MAKVEPDRLVEVLGRISLLSDEITELSNKVVEEVCEDLDFYMSEIERNLSTRNEIPVSDETLEIYVLNLASILYFVSDKQEDLGVRDDIAKVIQKDVYNRSRELAGGTIADKDMSAEMQSQAESVASIVYSRAYKKVKLRVETASEMINTLKKVISRRMTEMEISRKDTGVNVNEQRRPL